MSSKLSTSAAKLSYAVNCSTPLLLLHTSNHSHNNAVNRLPNNPLIIYLFIILCKNYGQHMFTFVKVMYEILLAYFTDTMYIITVLNAHCSRYRSNVLQLL